MSVPPTTVTWTGLPVLLDWADGVTEYPSPGGGGGQTVGTATPADLVNVAAANGAVNIDGIQIEELPDSPELERAEQATSTKRFQMPYDTGRNLISSLGRGVILQDNEGNQVRILSTSIKRQKPDMCIFTITSEGLSFDAPPDEFTCEPIELGVDIVKYPRYFYSLIPQSSDDTVVQQAKQSLVRAIQTYRDSPFFPPNSGSALNGLLNSNGQLTGQVQNNIASQILGGKLIVTIPNVNYVASIKNTNDSSWPVQQYSSITYPPTASSNGDVNPVSIQVDVSKDRTDIESIAAAYDAASEILQKLWRQEDTPYQVGFQITWSSYYFIKPFYNPGGYIENPITDIGLGNPGLPAYFGSPSFNYAINTIFDQIGFYNPQCYSQSGFSGGAPFISWLRKADIIDYQRTWFKVTRTWIGAAQAHFDADFYNQLARPGIANSAPNFGYDVLNLNG